jgi:hypothetical protein
MVSAELIRNILSPFVVDIYGTVFSKNADGRQ